MEKEKIAKEKSGENGFDFHYVYSPTGSISGESVLRQTEDAINDVGKYAKEAFDNSSDSLDFSKQALETAKDAQSTANNAFVSAESAVEKVNTLTVVVNGYDEKINTAVSTSQSANQTATEANKKSANAVETSNQALEASKNAQDSAQSSAESAENAKNEAETAKDLAQQSQQSAESASRDAADASLQARDSAETAQNALDTAQKAVNEAYAVRTYTAGSLTPNSTFDDSLLEPQGNIKVGDTVIDKGGLIFQIIAEVESEEEDQSLVTVGEVINDLNNFVSYGRTQELTEDQQSQARSNIKAQKAGDYQNKAPATAAAHNAIFRGDNLLNRFASIDALSTNIKAGNFDNIYIGDYIDVTMTSSIGGTETVRWCVAGIDTYLHTGDTELTTHHLTMIAEDCFKDTRVMNDTNTSAGGFAGTRMWAEFIPSYSAALENAIGANHVLTHRELISDSMNANTPSMAGSGWTGASSGWAWVDAKLMLPSEVQVYGSTVFSSSFYDVANRNRQLPYFAMAQDKIVAHLGKGSASRFNWWLSVVASATSFANVANDGNAYGHDASHTWVGIRPLFLLS